MKTVHKIKVAFQDLETDEMLSGHLEVKNARGNVLANLEVEGTVTKEFKERPKLLVPKVDGYNLVLKDVQETPYVKYYSFYFQDSSEDAVSSTKAQRKVKAKHTARNVKKYEKREWVEPESISKEKYYDADILTTSERGYLYTIGSDLFNIYLIRLD